LAKRARLAKGVPIQCVVRAVDDNTLAENDGYAETVMRGQSHPF